MTARGRLVFQAKRALVLLAGLCALVIAAYAEFDLVGTGGLIAGGWAVLGGVVLIVLGFRMSYEEEDSANHG